MCDAKKDIENLIFMKENRYISLEYNEIFPFTNEDVAQILSNVDVRGKNVLSVLSSGDQVFHLYKNGAKNVDTFDINILTFYYYYIRVWTMRYLNKCHVGHYLNIEYVKNLLSFVTPTNLSEKKAYDFWNMYINSFNDANLKSMFYSSLVPVSMSDFDFSDIRDRLENNNLKFYNIDLSGDFSIDSKYDIIYTSNIIESVRFNGVTKFRDNLFNLLNKNGIFLTVEDRSDCFYDSEKNDAFKNKFKIKENKLTPNGFYGDYMTIYKKKRFIRKEK